MLDRIFKLTAHGTTIKQEVIAGLTTFMAMSYIIALNPNLLTNFGTAGPELWNSIFVATIVSSIIAMLCMAFIANKPFCLAPGMGLNSFFATVTANMVMISGLSYLEAYQTLLCLIFFDGIIFIALTALNIREQIIAAIPTQIRIGMAPAIGLLLMDIGFGDNVGIFNSEGSKFLVLKDFFGGITIEHLKTQLGPKFSEMVLTVITIFIGIIAMATFTKKKHKGAVMLGMLIATIFYWIGQFFLTGSNPLAPLAQASFIPPVHDFFVNTFFKLNFSNLWDLGIFTIISLVLTFLILDLFDSIGTFIGLSSKMGLLDKNGNMPGMKSAMMSDAVGTVAAAFSGTSTVTTFIESAAGMQEGGKTGLTPLVTAGAFLACLFIAPIAAIIPPAATSAALIYVGAIMITTLKEVNFDDIEFYLPIVLMMIAMPISGSISHSIGIGIISAVTIGVLTGHYKKYSWLSYGIAIIFIYKFTI